MHKGAMVLDIPHFNSVNHVHFQMCNAEIKS